ncbi:LPXTG cell wall anchor domain-containing protein [Actinoplanes sp. NPDC048796]|uniref:LPXTG cell wall anchor domain-containing protein n=1 Tax=Actinoplanes sp. NPDC048796 TaxID=3155640 RepID=UPI0033EBE2DC
MRLRSLAVPAALAAAALGGLAAPAQAAPSDDESFVDLYLPEQVSVIQGKTKTIKAELYNAGRGDAKGTVISFTDVDPSLGLTLPAGCDATSCKIDLKAGKRGSLAITLKPTGDKLVSHFTASTGGFSSTVTVVRSTGGVDLEVDPIDDLKLNRGQAADVPIVVRNAGSETVDAIGLTLVAQPGLEALTSYRNCVTEVEGEKIPGVLCFFQQKFTPGTTFTVPSATPVKIKLRTDAGGPYTYSAAVSAVGVKGSVAGALTAGTGPVLTLEARRKAAVGVPDDSQVPDDLNEDDNIAVFGVEAGKSAADSAAVGGAFTGAIGDTTTVKVGLRNLGPTSIVPAAVEWYQTIRVTVPTGLKLTEVDEACFPGDGIPAGPDGIEGDSHISGRVYTCLPDSVEKGQQALFTFTGVITEEKVTAGSVTVDGGPQDGNAKNNTAALTLKLTGGGQGGGDDGPSLPVTGAPTGWVALGGALLLLAGGAVAYFFRRRRIVTTI